MNQKEDSYKDFAAELNSHYSKERLCAKEVVEGGFYAIQEEDAYHRYTCLFSSIPFLYIIIHECRVMNDGGLLFCVAGCV